MISYTIYGTEKWERYFTDYVHEYLLTKKYTVSICDKMDFKLDITNQYSNWYGIMRKNIIFQNNNTNQFFIINHADQTNDISEELVSHPLCIGMLKCQYRDNSCGELEHKVSAFTYGVKQKDEYFSARERLKNADKIYNTMYFKGNETGRKNVLVRLANMGLINKDYGFRTDSGERVLKISQEQYLDSMSKSKFTLSLPGIGNFCHRELESFGIGVPVIMPILTNRYYDNLIPDVHYIGIDISSIPKNRIKEYNNEEIETLCIMIQNKYIEVTNDNKFLDYIVTNAMTWFDNNIVFPHNMQLMEQILLKEFGYIL